MDWGPITLEPNLKFVLKDDLKKHEIHEKAKQTMANFNCFLQNANLEYQKLLEKYLNLSINYEKLENQLKDCKCNEKLSSNNNPNSEVISASTNCNLKVTPKSHSINKINNEENNDNIFYQKENICEYVEIHTEDFNSDFEEESFEKNRSPLRPVVNNSIKIQNSPILSKSKRYSSKKSNSSFSNNSITSSNDSKINLTPNNLEKIYRENDHELVECEKLFNKDPMQEIENNVCLSKSQNKNNTILSVSTTDYGKSEFTESGKKLRQSKLSIKKICPVIDLSKVDSGDKLKKSESQSKNNSSWNETLIKKEYINKDSSNKNERTFKKCISDFFDKKEFKVESEPMSPAIIKNLNQTYDDELIETSPAQSETSKLRNKLNMKKPENNKFKLSHTAGNSEKISSLKNSELWTNEHQNSETYQSEHDSEDNFKGFSAPSTSKQNQIVQIGESSQISTGEKRKSFEGQKSCNDETYFSLAELSVHKKNATEFDIDATNFEDEIKTDSPPLKKMLMSSFDVIPGRKEKSPKYAYKEAPVRRKVERAQLPGWSCKECEKWYDHLPKEEKIIRQNQCSRHRGKYKANNSTPESFWNPDFDNDESNSSPDDY